MADWDDTNNSRTLFLLKKKVGGKTLYSIYPWTIETRVTDGQQYVHPVPNNGLIGHNDMEFDGLEIIEDPGSNNSVNMTLFQ